MLCKIKLHLFLSVPGLSRFYLPHPLIFPSPFDSLIIGLLSNLRPYFSWSLTTSKSIQVIVVSVNQVQMPSAQTEATVLLLLMPTLSFHPEKWPG